MNEDLMEALLWAALFFEECDDRDCHPDVAVKQLEQVRFVLGRLGPHEREEFRRFAAELASRNPGTSDILPRLAADLVG